MFQVFLLILAAPPSLMSGVKRADTLHDERHGLHVHLYDQFVSFSMWKNSRSIVNVTSLPEHEHEHTTTDIFDIANLKEQGIAEEDIMQKVRDILTVAEVNDNLNDIFEKP